MPYEWASGNELECEVMTALALNTYKSCIKNDFHISSAVPAHGAMSLPLSLKPVLAGLFCALAQIALAVFLLAPEGSFSSRYSSLIQHDSYWFMNIVDRGYETTVPPIDHKVMEVSNVAFFPAYPALASLLRHVFQLDSGSALLITAQMAAWGFWTYFFLLCERWNLSPTLQVMGAMAIFAHPASFFLVAAYSESLFLMALLGFIYWSSSDSRRARMWAAVHGIGMSATRIVGIPCAAFPVVRSVFAKGRAVLRAPISSVRQNIGAIGLMIAATLGSILFFAYCQFRWGRWDLYMLTQGAGWGIVPDYLALLKPSSYRWMVPAMNVPIEASQMSVTIGALLLIGVLGCELLTPIRKRANWPTRGGIYFCAFVVFYIAMSGVACVSMESMLRYEFCFHALIVLALLSFLHQFTGPPMFVRAFGMAAVALICAAGLSLQGWYVWNFTRGYWVA